MHTHNLVQRFLKEQLIIMFFSKRFLPLFLVQFLGAFNDNTFRNALVMLITFELASSVADIAMLITLAAAIFILPFFLFSAFAGKIADSYNKTWLVKKIKLAEILIMLAATVALMTENVIFLFTILFFLGLQSTFFGPIKYSVLPEHLAENELLKGNGWFSGSTFVAILLGTLVGGAFAIMDKTIWLGGLIIFLAIIGYIASLFVPTSVEPKVKLKLSINFVKISWQEIKFSRQYPQAFFAVFAIAWFWFLGATYLSQVPLIVKELIFADEKVVLLFLATFSIGIAVGALIVNLLKITIKDISDVRWLAFLLLAISVAMWLSNLAIGFIEHTQEPLLLKDFFFAPIPMIVLLLLGTIAILGGMYTVPLYTLLQKQTPQGSRSRIVAVNNIINSMYMVLSAILIMLLYSIDKNLVDILFLISIINLLMFIWFYRYSQILKRRQK